MKLLLLVTLLITTFNTYALTPAERKAFLDAIRPQAESLAGQPVKFVVTNLNHQDNWYLLVGHLVDSKGQDLDWSKAKGCESELDKMLWVIAKKSETDQPVKSWRIDELLICSPEPPYWYLEKPAAFSKPCGLYAGLKDSSDFDDLEQECKIYNSTNAKPASH
jgi:hypothetical protein